METFEELQCQPELIESLKKSNIHHPTSTQTRVIPQLRSGRHTIVAAETGRDIQQEREKEFNEHRILFRWRENIGVFSSID